MLQGTWARAESLAVNLAAVPSRVDSWVIFPLALAMLGAALQGCSAIVAVQEPSRSFHPYISDPSVAFRVVDRRSIASKTPHQVGSSWYYGDELFSPAPVEVLADRFAQAFPKAQAETVLVITELELGYDLGRFGEVSHSCTPFFLFFDCAVTKADVNSRNVVSARLSGTFDGIPFSGSYDAEYKDHDSDRQEKRVLSALQSAIDKALTAVHERLARVQAQPTR